MVRAQPSTAGASAQRGSPARVSRVSLASATPPVVEPSRVQASEASSLVYHGNAYGSIPMGGCSRTNFLVPFKLSVNGNDLPFTVILDSGSADLAIATTACDSTCSGIPGAFPFYSAGPAVPNFAGVPPALSYGSAALWGYVFTEHLQLLGLPEVGIHMLGILRQQGLLRPVTCTLGDAARYTYTGILGFGPDETAQYNDASIVGLLAAAGVPKIFAPALCAGPEGGGRLYIGGYDSSVIMAPPLYTPLHAAGKGPDGQPLYRGYLVQVSGIRIQGYDLGLYAENSFWLVDTGTNFLGLPPVVAANAAVMLDEPMKQLTGIADFFARQLCTAAIAVTPTQLDAALPNLDFSFPSVTQGVTITLSAVASMYTTYNMFANGTYQYCSFTTSDAAGNAGANILPNTLMVRSFPSTGFGFMTSLQRITTLLDLAPTPPPHNS